MKQRISDLLDGMEFEGVELTECPEIPVNRIRERTMKKVRQSTQTKKAHTLSSIKRVWQIAACIVLVISIGTVTAFAASPAFRSKLLSVLRLEAHDTGDLSPINTETFTTVEGMDGVSMHYIPLNSPADDEHYYEPDDGVLISYDEEPYFQAVTEDYQLEVLETKEVNETIQWQGESVTIHFAYATYQDQLYFNHLNGPSVSRYSSGNTDEVLLWMPRGIDDIPVVYNLSTGALTDLTEKIDWNDLPSDEERVSLGLCDGSLYYTDDSYPAPAEFLYRANCDTGEVVKISAPEAGRGYLDSGSVYWMTPIRKLYRLDEQDQWVPILEEISNLTQGVRGLLTGETKENHLAVADVLNNTVYEIPDLEIGGYSAYRYSDSGLIALIRMNLSMSLGVSQIGILSPEDGQVHLLERDMNTQDDCCGWFDENRFVIMCIKDGQKYLCLYEFE